MNYEIKDQLLNSYASYQRLQDVWYQGYRRDKNAAVNQENYDRMKASAAAICALPAAAEIIEAIRADVKVGRNTLTHVDECYEDIELIETIIREEAFTPKKAVRAMRRCEKDVQSADRGEF